MTYNLKRAQNHVWQHFVRFSCFLVNENSVYLSTSLDFDDLFKNWEQKKSTLFFCDFPERFVFFTFFMDFVHISQTRWILSIEYKSFSREQLLSQSFCQLFHFDSCGPRIPDLIQLMGFFYILGRPLRAYICKGYSKIGTSKKATKYQKCQKLQKESKVPKFPKISKMPKSNKNGKSGEKPQKCLTCLKCQKTKNA